ADVVPAAARRGRRTARAVDVREAAGALLRGARRGHVARREVDVRDRDPLRSAPVGLEVHHAAAAPALCARDRAGVAAPARAAAAAYANAHFPPNTVILWDASLRPAAEYLLPRFKSAALERGLRDYYARPDVPLVLLDDGGSNAPDAHVFSWRESDAYGK